MNFAYPCKRDNQMLSPLSLQIPRGKEVVLVGETDYGKPTTLQLT